MPPPPDAATRPAVPAELFISYASPDLARAEALRRRLAQHFTVWFDRERLKPGYNWHQEIAAAADAARLVLPLMTPCWRQSDWTKYETYAAAAVLPILAEGMPEDVLPPPLRHLQACSLDPLTATETAWQALFAAIYDALAKPVPDRAPVLARLAYPPTLHFTGREPEMNRLHEALHPAPSAQRTQVRAWAITGLGGLGKTTLANEYVCRFERLYRQALWVDAGRGYAAEFAAIHAQMFPDGNGPDIPDAHKAARVMAALAGPDSRLLVLDNVANQQDAAPWIPQSGGCRTLLTSRFTDFSAAVGTIPLDELPPEASRAFLLARTAEARIDRDGAACDAVAQRLEHLPLALEQAGAYLVRQRMGFSKYLRRLEEAAAELMAKHAPGTTDYRATVATTWLVTTQAMSAEGRAILRLSAAMGSAPIRLEMLTDGASQVVTLGATLPELHARRSWLPWRAARDAGPQRAPPEPDKAKARQAVEDAVGGELHAYSMIQHWNGEAFRVHRLVRDVEWETMDKAARRYASGLFARMLETHAPADPRDRTEHDACDAALVHGAALWARLKQAGLDWPDEKLPGVLYECAAARGAVAAAEAYALEYYEAAKRHRGPISDVTRRAAVRVADSLYRRGEYAAALPIFRVILHACEVQDGPEHPDTLASMNNLALCMKTLGDVAGALSLNRRALDSCERVLGREQPTTLTSVNNLAECMRALGDAAGALPLARRALDSRQRVLGEEHPDTLSSMNNVALCLDTLGDRVAALPLYRRALDSRERVLGKEHPATLNSMNNLAGCMQTLGDAAGALPLFRRTLDSRERVLGEEHPDTVASVNNLAWCLRALGDAAGALPLFRRALDGRERVRGKEHPQTRSSAASLAALLAGTADSPDVQPPEPAQAAWAVGAAPLSALPGSAGVSLSLDLAGLLSQVAEPAAVQQQPPDAPSRESLAT